MPEDAAKASAPPAPEAAQPLGVKAPATPLSAASAGSRRLLGKLNPLNFFKRVTPASLVREGHALEANRNLAQATVAFNRALALDPDYAPAYEGLGNVMLKKGGHGNLEAAVFQYRESLKRDPFNGRAYAALGKAFDMLGRRKEAALEKKKLLVVRTLQADPGNPAANNNMGILFLQQGYVQPAVDYFSRAIQTDPRYDTSLRNLAITYYKLASEAKDPAAREQNLALATDYAEQALAIAESPLTLLAKARILILEGRHEDALVVCGRVEAIDPAMKELFGLKKVALMKLNRLEEANKAYETYRFLNSHE